MKSKLTALAWAPACILLLIAAISCNGSTNSSPDQDKDSLVVHPQIHKDRMVIPGYESFKAREESIKKRLQFLESENISQMEKLAGAYTAKEVYIEILQRAGDLGNKDTIPSAIGKCYTPAEFRTILEKNKGLKSLSGNDLLNMYTFFYPESIIGDDNRAPVLYNYNNPQEKAATLEMEDAKCVMAIIPKDSLKPDGKGKFVYQCTATFGSRHNLCGERFSEEPAYSSMTGFAAGRSTMITAAHCIDENNYMDYYYVFDYILDSNKFFYRTIDSSKVFQAIGARSEYNIFLNLDYSVVTLNKKVDAFRIRKLKTSGQTGTGSSYHVIGTPGGLPLKISGSAKVRTNNASAYFTILSDTYKGNSGSPVFNSQTHEIEGILVKGAKDFDPFKKLPDVVCRKSIVCPVFCEDAKDGERVSRVSQFVHLLPNN
ncbi:MAG: trypsin-like serine peptidase [Pseudobacter sp.]|uniref:trypsin-like serine peptidase n=1 Tax=Pseudobacter sp. TaxID=2045420 RepID=UPI003F7EA986